MPLAAHDVAAVLRERLPGLPVKKLHKLLYYCQGHHLATFDEPLFADTIEAWDMGPVVSTLWRAEKHGAPSPARQQLGEAELNTIGYVLSRYGALTGKDLENLTHSEDPWLTADEDRPPGGSTTIKHDVIARYFRTNSSTEGEEGALDRAVISQWLQETTSQPAEPGRPLGREELLARFAEIEARLGD
ncbi:MAG: Panacea domain-containing protein [Pseudonocardiaceae bacterium]